MLSSSSVGVGHTYTVHLSTEFVKYFTAGDERGRGERTEGRERGGPWRGESRESMREERERVLLCTLQCREVRSSTLMCIV